jgi:N-acetylglucosaminyl-diphospho-decaprenol L-rhamnosyltransferase
VSATDPVVSALVVTWNSAGDVAGCLGSLPAEVEGVPLECIVVDNASSDATVDAVRAAAPSAQLIVNATNRGLAAANNQAMAVARGEFLLIANPDVVLAPGALGAMVATLRRHDGAGWVVPRYTYEDGAGQTSVGSLPELSEVLWGRQLARRRSGEQRGFWWDGWPHDTEQPVGRGLEAAYLVRRSAVDAVGPQDERYVLDWEGFDWAERFRRAGWEIWFCPDASVLHLGGTSRRQVPFRAVISQHRGMYRYFADRRPKWVRPLLGLAFSVRAVVKLAVTASGVPLYSRAHRSVREPCPPRRAPRAPSRD